MENPLRWRHSVDVWERIILGILKQESEIVPVPIPSITRARRAISGDKPVTTWRV